MVNRSPPGEIRIWSKIIFDFGLAQLVRYYLGTIEWDEQTRITGEPTMTTNTNNSMRWVAANHDPRNRVLTALDVDQAATILRRRSYPSSFVVSVLDAYSRYGRHVSPGRADWIIVMAQQDLDRQAAAQAVQNRIRPRVALTSDFAGLTALLTRARDAGKKFPRITLKTAEGRTVVLALAVKGKYPGAVQVTDDRKYPGNTWYGRIETDGSWVAGAAACDDVLDLLKRFAADPVQVAREFGKATGQCCFCKAGLTDARSVDVGYGPICADKFGLPWGEKEWAEYTAKLVDTGRIGTDVDFRPVETIPEDFYAF